MALNLHAAASVSEIVREGKRCVLLENRFIRMIVSPTDGGMCSLLEHKPTGKRFTLPGSAAVLGNRVWNYADRDLYLQWERRAWEHEIRKAPGEAAVVLRADGEAGFTRSTQFERRIVLRDGECKVSVEYVFHVGQELMTPQRIGLWFKNVCTVSDEPMTCYLPLDDGTVALDQTATSGQSWYYNPSRGWVAVAGTSGTGLAFEIEYRRLMCFYLLGRGNKACVEWAFRSFDIPNGGSLRTEGEIVAFTGLPAVHGAGEGVVAGFDVPPSGPADGARAVLFAGQPTRGDLAVTLQRLPDGAVEEIQRQAINLPVGEPTSIPLRLAIKRPGTWVLRGRILREGQERMDFTTSVTVGKPSAPCRIAPIEKRIGRATERFEDKIALRGSAPKDIELSTEIGGEHTKWAKPYSKGKLRVLVLTSFLNGREAVELAQRLDMEVLWVSAGDGRERGGLPGVLNLGRHAPYTVEHMNEAIRERLTQRVDAVIVGGLSGELFQPETLAAIRRKVEEGMGLVWVAPNRGAKELYDMLPVDAETHLRHRNGKWKAVKPHFLTTGVPFEELPSTDYVRCRAKVEPLATVGRGPLLVAAEGPGRGRCVVLSYNTGWQGVGEYMTGITPWIRNAPQKFRYWEHHFSLLSKCLVWAARREPEVTWREFEVVNEGGAPNVVAYLQNPGPPLTVEAHVTVSDAWGCVLHRARMPVEVSTGASRFAIPLKASLPDGLSMVDMILRDRGKVVQWGSVPLRRSTGVQITDLSFDKRIYYPNETARAAVRLSSDPRRPLTVRAVLSDSLGRCVGEELASIEAGADDTVAFELPIGKPLATVGQLRVTASDRGRLLAAREADFIMLPEKFANRKWGEWQSTLWGNPAGAYDRDYMIPLKAKVCREYGLDTVITSSNWLYDTEYDAALRAGFQIMPMNCCFGALRLSKARKGKLTFDAARAGYVKTNDKKFLVRALCLNSSAELEPLAEKIRKVAAFAGRLEPIGYNLGDEMSITHYVTPFDYCFGDESLAHFREWLKRRYDRLADLNRSWDTTYQSWEAAMPMTAREVRGRGNYAPWAEHREFMDDTLQNFFHWVREQLREHDPKATVGMSGSQAAEAYGGYDWSKLVHTLDFAQNYVHQDTIIMQRSFGSRLPRAPWYGYMRRNPDMRQALWQRFLNGNRGGSYFVIRYMFFPDYRPTVSTQHAAEVIAEFRNGLATLFNRLERVNEIAIHYSHPSIRGAFICGDAGVFRNNRHGWVQALEDLGVQCELVSSKEIAAGELGSRRYAAVVLPYSVAMSRAEVDALRRYVQRGGLLIADGKVGLMDEKCRTLAAGTIDDLLGIRRGKADPLAPRREGTALVERSLGECRLEGLKVDVELAETGLRVGKGTALGSHTNAPVLIVNRVGEGAAVCLNFLMDSFPRRRDLGMDADLRRIVANLLQLRGVEPSVRVAPEGTEDARFYVVRFRSGQATYVGVLHQLGLIQGRKRGVDRGETPPDQLVPVRVELPGESFVYDIRAGKALGRCRRTKATIRRGDAKLYALLPYEVRGLEVQVRGGGQGDVVHYSARLRSNGGKPGLHVFRVQVTDPSGQRLCHYEAKLVAAAGMAEGEFRTALNDPAGSWTLRVTDVATGLSSSTSFKLSAD